MIAVRGRLEFARSFNDDPVLPHQSPDPAMAYIDANFLQFLSHPGTAMAAQAQTRLFLDRGKNNHVHTLPATGRAAAKGSQPAGADIPHLAQPVDREGPTLLFDEPEPHRFWLAKNWVAFFQDLPLSPGKQSPRLFRGSGSNP